MSITSTVKFAQETSFQRETTPGQRSLFDFPSVIFIFLLHSEERPFLRKTSVPSLGQVLQVQHVKYIWSYFIVFIIAYYMYLEHGLLHYFVLPQRKRESQSKDMVKNLMKQNQLFACTIYFPHKISWWIISSLLYIDCVCKIE